MIVCDIAIHYSNQKMQRDLTFRWNDKSVSKFFEACFRPYFTQLRCKKTANKVLALIALSAATVGGIVNSSVLHSVQYLSSFSCTFKKNSLTEMSILGLFCKWPKGNVPSPHTGQMLLKNMKKQHLKPLNMQKDIQFVCKHFCILKGLQSLAK